jgi:MoxR-like ATPase
MGLLERLGLIGKRTNLENMFDNIVGHDDAKDVLVMAVQSVKPVHVLLKGPFGIGKTELMQDIRNYVGDRNSHWAIGSRTSKAGLSDLLLEKNNLEYLFIDEMESLPRKDQYVLLSAMENGVISETLYGKTKGRQKKVNVRVIATSNDTRKLDRALLTRFSIVNMGSYSEDEFVKIALAKSLGENVEQDTIEFIARAVYSQFSEPTVRDVIKVARLSKGDEDKILKLISVLGIQR